MGATCSTKVLLEQCGSDAHTMQQQASLQNCGICSSVRVTNRPVAAAKTYDRAAPLVDGCGRIHVVICALDYLRTSSPLACSADGQSMFDLAQACGADNVQVLHDQHCTKDNVAAVVRQVGRHCGQDDYFVFCYSGRCLRLQRATGQGEAFGFVDESGQMTGASSMRGTEFSRLVTSCVPAETRILLLADCSGSDHAGVVVDLSLDDWRDREAVSIAGHASDPALGVQNRVPAGDSSSPTKAAHHGGGSGGGASGAGGIFTQALLLAIERLQKLGEYDYSAGMIYNTVLEESARVFDGPPDITAQASCGTGCHEFAWPLVPQGAYTAPLSRFARMIERDAKYPLVVDEHELMALGVRPRVLPTVRTESVVRDADPLPDAPQSRRYPRAVMTEQCLLA